MTFGYNAAAAFGQSTADVTDHAKGLLSSLVYKREESEVHIGRSLPHTMEELTTWQEKKSSCRIYNTISRWNCRETSEMTTGCAIKGGA